MSTEPRGVYLDYVKKITTLDVPHAKARIGKKTFYFGKMPEGDYRKHYHQPGYEEGYGGKLTSFLMEDGSIETVKGPFSCDGMFEFGDSRRLAELTGNSDLLLCATRLIVGRNLGQYPVSPNREVIYEETEFSVKPIRERLNPEWAGLQLEIRKRDGACYRKVDDYLEGESE